MTRVHAVEFLWETAHNLPEVRLVWAQDGKMFITKFEQPICSDLHRLVREYILDKASEKEPG